MGNNHSMWRTYLRFLFSFCKSIRLDSTSVKEALSLSMVLSIADVAQHLLIVMFFVIQGTHVFADHLHHFNLANWVCTDVIGDSANMENCIAWSVRLTGCWSWLETWRIITNFQVLKDEPQIIRGGAIWWWLQWWHTPKHVFSDLHVTFTYYPQFFLESLPWRSIGFNIYLIFHASNGEQPLAYTEKLLCSSFIYFMKQWKLVGTRRCHPPA